ncbi:ras-like protein family member 10B isoform X1 [Galleria mellonella]|uniref:Ras-like protein family member 10B isoform X1 n=1 Tax=Galleria mellonella TaxID=7137 RepID=A0ABM3MKS0_GALME|nr:ras-like protein family member 10B isoform X1 [Galleria mellonella]
MCSKKYLMRYKRRTSQATRSRHSDKKYTIQLDLDYLERGGGGTLTVGGAPSVEPSPDSLDLIKVVLLGAPAVGKTSIIQQFVWSDFSEEYVPTDRKHTFYPSVIINEHLYEVKITDVPVIPYFPINSYYEWAHYRFYGLRNATAYILVFDLSNVETFQYIRTLREQMVESRDMRNVPVLVVGNKQDLLCSNTPSAASGLQQLAIAESACGDSREKRRNIVNLVRKHWKCGYVECSAKYNWRVIAVFKELMEMIDALEWSGGGRTSEPMPDSSAGGGAGSHENRCVVA